MEPVIRKSKATHYEYRDHGFEFKTSAEYEVVKDGKVVAVIVSDKAPFAPTDWKVIDLESRKFMPFTNASHYKNMSLRNFTDPVEIEKVKKMIAENSIPAFTRAKRYAMERYG